MVVVVLGGLLLEDKESLLLKQWKTRLFAVGRRTRHHWGSTDDQSLDACGAGAADAGAWERLWQCRHFFGTKCGFLYI